MKNTFIILLFIVTFVPIVHAQQDKQRAENYFERAFYKDAIPLYEEVAKTDKSLEVIKNLADSYYNTYQLPKAAKWYSYLTYVYATKINESYYYKYSQTLKAVGEYEEATRVLVNFYNKHEDNAKVEKLMAELKHLENVDAIGNRFNLTNLGLNTTSSEFGAAVVNNNLVYAAPTKSNSSSQKKYRWNNENYLDLYAHPLSEIAKGDSLSVSFSETINTKMHEAIFDVTANGKTIYFTRNNFIKGKKKTDSKKISNLKIYRAEWDNNEWKNITELSINSDDYSVEHPALSADEKTLYFASDMPGGLGSFDIYKVGINNDGSLGEPVNLGPKINTDEKEQFPFIDAEDNLYFSSNGWAGFGLLDVFIAKLENGIYSKADNIGRPINGGYDDFAYNLTDAKNGYFSSNRPEGKGSDDIYQLEITKPLIIEDCKQYIVGAITDATTANPIAFAKLKLVDSTGETVETQEASEMGTFKFTVTCDANYTVEASKIGYESNSKAIAASEKRNYEHDASMTLLSEKEIENQKALALKKKKDDALKEKEEAKRLAKLAENERIAEEKRIKEAKLMAEKAAKEKAEKELAEKIERAIAREPNIVREGERIIIKADPKIYFDYDLWYIRLESKETLEEIIRILKENPGITMEIGTHTDIRGNNAYNEELSQKRSNSVYKYLVSKGVDKNRLIAKGYGETRPMIKCATEEACTEEQHEINRRSEFVIVKWE